jgi:uncharacterized protein YaaN involved in tellurite resistance
MVKDERSDQHEEDKTLSPTDSQERTPEETNLPVAPKGLPEEELQELRNRSVDFVEQLKNATGSRELELIDNITNLGIQAQRGAGAELDLLRTRVGEMLTQDGPSEKIAKDLIDLRLTLNEIDPRGLSKPAFWKRMLRMIPILKRLVPALRVLEEIAIRYEPVCKQAKAIEARLREGRMLLTRDNVELRKLYEHVEAQQLPIQKNIYLGELIRQQLDEVGKSADDPLKDEKIRNSLHDVSMRVQDLRTMEEVYVQFFVSIEMTRQNNTRLGQSVERTLSMATNLVTVGLAIQSALSRQRRVLEATQRTQEFLGDLVVANAAAIKQHTEEIGDIYNNPVIAIEKITEAHNQLIEAMDTASRLKQEGIDSARENIAKLGQMSADLRQKASVLLEPGEAEVKSIEA